MIYMINSNSLMEELITIHLRILKNKKNNLANVKTLYIISK